MLICGFMMANAQSPTFEKGDKVINLGIGFGGYGTWGYHVAVPPVSISGEVGILDNILDKGSIGVGGYLGYASYKETGYYANEYWTFNRLFIGARGVFHYPFIDKFDTYAGLTIGFNSYSWKWHGAGSQGAYPGSSGLGSSVFVGGRYYLSDKFGLMGELGYGISYINIGIALKL